MTWNDVVFMLPEIILSIGASLLLIAPVIGRRSKEASAKWATLIVLAITALAVVICSNIVETLPQTVNYSAMFALDGFAIFFKLLFIAAVAMIVLLSDDFLRESRYSAWEYYSLLGFALVGMMFMASGVHLASIYIGLELMSLSSYILAGFFKNEQKSTEAAMKYFVLGTVSSGILLYGISLIYGVTGSLNLLTIAKAMSTIITNDALMFGILLLGAGLCFKIAAVPFHVWTPDVYEGAPTPIAAFLSTASKGAAVAIFARIFYVGFHDFQLDWSNILATISALSMILGNLAALTQDNVKRMLAYSSIGHAGYVLLGILSLNAMGLRGVLIYTLVYVSRVRRRARRRLRRTAQARAVLGVRDDHLSAVAGGHSSHGGIHRQVLSVCGRGAIGIRMARHHRGVDVGGLDVFLFPHRRGDVLARRARSRGGHHTGPEARGRREPGRDSAFRNPARAADQSGHAVLELGRRPRRDSHACRTITATKKQNAATCSNCSTRRRSGGCSRLQSRSAWVRVGGWTSSLAPSPG